MSEFVEIPVTITARIVLPVQAKFKAQPDITAFELAQVLPYLFGKPMYEAEWDALGTAQRHWTRLN